MVEVTSSEFARNFGRYRDAAQREPVVVTNHDRVTGVLISAQDYADYQRLKQRATRALYVEELSDEALRAIERGSMDARHADLDRLLDED